MYKSWGFDMTTIWTITWMNSWNQDKWLQIKCLILIERVMVVMRLNTVVALTDSRIEKMRVEITVLTFFHTTTQSYSEVVLKINKIQKKINQIEIKFVSYFLYFLIQKNINWKLFYLFYILQCSTYQRPLQPPPIPIWPFNRS